MSRGRGGYGYEDTPPAPQRDGYSTRGAREGGGGGRGAYNGGGGNDFRSDEQDTRGSSFNQRGGGTGGRGAFSNGGDDFRSQDRDSYENRDSFAQRGGGSSMRGGRGGGEFGGGGVRDSYNDRGYDERPPERSEFSTGGGGRGGASAGRGGYDRNDSFDQRGPPQGGRGGGSGFQSDRPPRDDYAEQDRYAPSGGRGGGAQNFANDRSNGYSGGGGRGDGGYESNDRAFEDYGKGTNKTPLNTNSEHSSFGGRGQDNRQQYDDRADGFNDNRGMSNNRGGGNAGGRPDFQSEFSTGGRSGRSGGDYDNQQGGFRGGGQSFGQRGGGPGRGGFNNGGDFQDGNRDAFAQDSFRGGGAPRGGRGGGPVGRGGYGQNDSFGPPRGGRGGGGNFQSDRGNFGDDGGFSGGRGGGASRGGGYGQSDGGFPSRGGRGGGGSFRGGHSDGFGDQDNEGQFGGGGFQGGRGGGQGGGPRSCYNCGGGGPHEPCPNPRDESCRPMGAGGGGGGACYNCGQPGHMSRECPNGNNGLFRQQRPMEDRGPIRPAHCPVERDIDAIFADDKERQQGAQLYDLDGQVEVDPLPEPLCGVGGHPLQRDHHRKHQAVAALIIEPTRELAIQLTEQARKFANGTSVSVNSAYGEYKISQNKNKIHLEGCDILIGTPGRLKHFMGPEVPEFLSKATEPLPFEYATVNPDGTTNDAPAEAEEPEFD
ncbi:RNA helicase [Aphelenchoides fujianensis]|nr:RNA helicase [Aphelenchoides fujianensis]